MSNIVPVPTGKFILLASDFHDDRLAVTVRVDRIQQWTAYTLEGVKILAISMEGRKECLRVPATKANLDTLAEAWSDYGPKQPKWMDEDAESIKNS